MSLRGLSQGCEGREIHVSHAPRIVGREELGGGLKVSAKQLSLCLKTREGGDCVLIVTREGRAKSAIKRPGDGAVVYLQDTVPTELVDGSMVYAYLGPGHKPLLQFKFTAPPAVVDLTAEAPPAKRARGAAPPEQVCAGPDGVLHSAVLARVEAIAQQLNCTGAAGKGLAEAVARKLPYGCSYKDRRRESRNSTYAVDVDRAKPGTIDVRRPPAGTAPPAPTVINLFAQWEKGPPGIYKRAEPAPAGGDTAQARERWFSECLEAIGALSPAPRSIAMH